MADQSADLMPSATQKPFAAIVAVAAILAVGAVTAIAIWHYKKASEAVTVLGPVVAIISSLVAAYFGVRSGSLTQQKANEAEAIRQQPGGRASLRSVARRPRQTDAAARSDETGCIRRALGRPHP